MMVHDQEEVGEGSEMPTDPHYTPTIIQPSTSQPQKKQRSRRSKRKDTEMDGSLERAATTATGLDAEQDRGIINKTRSKATLNEPSSSGTSSSSGPRHQETMGDTIAQTRSENVSKLSNDPLLARVLALETIKTTQATEIASLKKRVKKLERRNKLRTHGLKRLYIVGSSRRVESSKDEDMFGVNDLDGDEVIVESVVFSTVKEIRNGGKKLLLTRPKAKGIVFHDQEQAHTPTVSLQQPLQVKVQDKGKGKMVEPEPMNKMSKKELLRLDEELVFKLQVEEEEEEERLAREKSQQWRRKPT
ncbi:hypothetical protein Tco_1410191 [Tanacetum coccineum]